MTNASEIDPALVRETFDYRDGMLFWRHPGPRRRVGARAGTNHSKGYRTVVVGGAYILEHRAVWAWHTGAWPVAEIDHVDGNKRHNRFENLRAADRALNTQNMHAARRDSATGLAGVWCHGKRFRASIQARHTRHHLGTFDTPDAAYQAYLNAKATLHPGCAGLPLACEKGQAGSIGKIVKR